MSIEAFEDKSLPLGDALTTAVLWLDESRDKYLNACQEYSSRPSAICQDALRTHLDDSTLALQGVITELTATDMSEQCVPVAAALLFHEDSQYVTQLRILAPSLTFNELLNGKEIIEQGIGEARIEACGANDAFAGSVSAILKSAANKDLDRFISWVNQQHAWGKAANEPGPTVPEPGKPLPAQSSRRELVDIARTTVSRLGRLTVTTLRAKRNTPLGHKISGMLGL